MPEPTVDVILNVIQSAGITGLLTLIIVGGFRGWWYYGRDYKALAAERDEWRRLAIMSSDMARRAVELGSELVK